VLVALGNGRAVEQARDALLGLALAGFDFVATAREGSDPDTHTATSDANAGHERLSIAGSSGWKKGWECGFSERVGNLVPS